MDHVYRVTEIVGSSPNSLDEAIRNGIGRATQTLHHVDWFEVTEIRGAVQDDQLSYFQGGIKAGFRLEEAWRSMSGSGLLTGVAPMAGVNQGAPTYPQHDQIGDCGRPSAIGRVYPTARSIAAWSIATQSDP